MKSSIYFLSVVISTFLGSVFLMEYPKLIPENSKTPEPKSIENNWEEDYAECKKMIDSIDKNNKITKQNLDFVKRELSKLN